MPPISRALPLERLRVKAELSEIFFAGGSSTKIAATTMLTSAIALIPLLPTAELSSRIKTRRMSAECTGVSIQANDKETSV